MESLEFFNLWALKEQKGQRWLTISEVSYQRARDKTNSYLPGIK